MIKMETLTVPSITQGMLMVMAADAGIPDSNVGPLSVTAESHLLDRLIAALDARGIEWGWQ